MSDEATEIGRIEDRIQTQERWLRENAPECGMGQKHLNEGSQERVYWNYGYLVALRDVMRLLRGD